MLTRLAPLVVVTVVVGCAGHAPVSTPASAPTPAPACAPKVDSLQTAVTDPGDSSLVVSIGDTTARACGPDRLTFVIHTIDPRAARDALDAGIDVLITNDPAAVAYAARRPDYVSMPLPWDRLYVLVLPALLVDQTQIRAFQTELDARTVRAEARPYVERVDDACDDIRLHTGPGNRPRVVYSEADSVARALAERAVAVFDRSGARLRAVGLPSNGFVAAVDSGKDVAYILALTPSACSGAIPLIETRPRAIVRRDLHLAVVGQGP